ncbi:MAG: hypothetical protein FJ125_05655 [Deltaproteobacteria bacterium]|nr:hypothetical protein [Deltaproteobacteria bacterium]
MPAARRPAPSARTLLALLALLAACSLLAAAALAAPPPALCLSWETFQPSNGFPALLVNDVVLDRDEVWAATSEGIAHRRGERAPGQGWEVFSLGEGMPHRLVWALAVANNGDVWAATPRGLVRLSGGRVAVFSVRDSGLPADVVYDVALSGHEVWVATAGGLARLDLHDGGWRIWSPESSVLPVAAVSRVVAAWPQQKRIWLATFGGGLWSLEPEQDRWQGWPRPEQAGGAARPAVPGGELPAAPLLLSPGPDGDDLLLGSGAGLGRLRQGAFTTLLPATPPRQPAPAPSPWVRSAAWAGELLFAGTDRGLAVQRGGQWIVYLKGEGGQGRVLLPAGQPGSPPRELLLEKDVAGAPIQALALGDGEIWLATAAGLARCQAPRPGELAVEPWAAAPAPDGRALEDAAAAPRGPAVLPPPQAADPGALPAHLRQIPLGLVLPARPEQSPAAAVAQGARLALEQLPASPRDGPYRFPFVLQTRELPALPWDGLAAAQAAELLFQDGARLLLLAPSATGAAELEQLQLATHAGLPLLLLAGDDPLQQSAAARPWAKLAGPSGEEQISLLFEQMASKGRRRPVLVHDAGRFGRTGTELFAREAAARRLAPAGQILHQPGSRTVEATVEAVARLTPDALVLWAAPVQAGLLLRALAAAGLRLPCFAPARLDTPAFLQAAGEAAEGCILALPALPRPGPAWDAFARSFQQRFGVAPDRWAALGYGATRWAMDELAQLERLDRETVALSLPAALPRFAPELLLDPRGSGREDGEQGHGLLGVVRSGAVVPLAGR